MLYNFYAPILHNLIPLNTTYDGNYCKSSAKKDKNKMCDFIGWRSCGGQSQVIIFFCNRQQLF
jgi:hypothetical protein